MRQSSYFIETLRENPAEAEVISHRLMMRAGMIKKVAAGIYNYMPMGLRVIRKIENIVRESMNEAGAIELLMSAVQPAELWQESKRWNHYGKELLRFKDRNGRDFCIGPTHEEVITDIVRGSVNSYKQLPLNLYQIQTKFRDEVRPRFGLMRGREFIMKDAYSFDIDDKGAEIAYEKMYKAYRRIFEKCGLRYKVVDADSGSIGGSFSHEFMVLADTGEDAVISCKSCEYSANIEKALVKDMPTSRREAALKPEKIDTPNIHSVDEVSKFLDIDIKKIAKTMVIKCEGVPLGDKSSKTADKFVLVMVRGDRELNLAKVKNLLGAVGAEFATAEEIVEAASCRAGSLGPIGSKLELYADYEIRDAENMVVGANIEGVHIKNINAGVDFAPIKYADLRNAVEGDVCSSCGGVYELTRGIEVGHIFKLGLKYSKALGANALTKEGKAVPLSMGCYGIGIGRTAASAIEQNNDEKGIIWTKSIAPFEVAVIPLNTNDEEVTNLAEDIYKGLLEKNVDVIIDDRNERAGVKLNDADLIGYPLRISVGRKALAEGNVEIVIRKTLETITVKKDEALIKTLELLEKI